MVRAIASLEVLGMPQAQQISDVLTKASTVALHGLNSVGAGRISVVISGALADVEFAVSRALMTGVVLSHQVIRCPDPGIWGSGLWDNEDWD